MIFAKHYKRSELIEIRAYMQGHVGDFQIPYTSFELNVNGYDLHPICAVLFFNSQPIQPNINTSFGIAMFRQVRN